MDDLAHRLAERTLELVDIPSESLHEEAIREHMLGLIPPGYVVEHAGDEAYLLMHGDRTGAPLVLLVGHYDTVRSQGNLPGRIEGGWVHGLGAADMKGGVAVALELVRDLAGEACPFETGLVVFGREELPAGHDPLPALLDASAVARSAALAVVLEPTAGRVEAGCLGNVVARLTFHGRSGHSARPWLADNAITRALDGLAPIVHAGSREAVVAGLRFVETISVTRIEGGLADNVIPGEATATVNFRYAPDRTPAEAEAHVRALFSRDVAVDVAGVAPPGAVVTDSVLVQRLLDIGARGLEAKLAWTNVADFTAAGIDAVNFGPGDPAFAHAADERVEIDALVHAYETLRRLLTEGV
jgi:succinyl-diaminopimelate desuccinylase